MARHPDEQTQANTNDPNSHLVKHDHSQHITDQASTPELSRKITAFFVLYL
jgi:hypothetical protein